MVLSRYKTDGCSTRQIPQQKGCSRLMGALVDAVNAPPRFRSMESGDSLRRRLPGRLIRTDDNMGEEWRNRFAIPRRRFRATG
jgi:hypothetical protein